MGRVRKRRWVDKDIDREFGRIEEERVRSERERSNGISFHVMEQFRKENNTVNRRLLFFERCHKGTGYHKTSV